MTPENEKIDKTEKGDFSAFENETGDFAAPESGTSLSAERNDLAERGMMNSYKTVCFKSGLFLTIALSLRILAQGFAPLAIKAITAISTNEDVVYALKLLYSAVFLQIIPSFIAAAMLNYGFKNLVGGFKPPKNSKKAFADFPAIYGAAVFVNIITILITQLISRNVDITKLVNNALTSVPSMASVIALAVSAVIIAPIFEEFIFRGAIMNALKPYGSGIAVFFSAFWFAVFHGNFQQFFYAFAMGIFLGYISYATKSIFCSTIMHAMFNSISIIMVIFETTEALKKKIANPTAVLSNQEHLTVTMYAIFTVIILITAFIGFIMIIYKFIKIKKHRLPKVWGEVGNGKKIMILIFTLTTLLALMLTVDVMGTGYISNYISDLVRTNISA